MNEDKDNPIRHRQPCLMVENVSPALRAAFKTACARRGKTMREVLLAFMKYYHNQTFDKKDNPPKRII